MRLRRQLQSAADLALGVRKRKVECGQHDAGSDASLQPKLHDGSKGRQQQGVLWAHRQWREGASGPRTGAPARVVGAEEQGRRSSNEACARQPNGGNRGARGGQGERMVAGRCWMPPTDAGHLVERQHQPVAAARTQGRRVLGWRQNRCRSEADTQWLQAAWHPLIWRTRGSCWRADAPSTPTRLISMPNHSSRAP